MLINVTFNNKIYKHRQEENGELLLYRIRLEKIMILKGGTKEKIIEIINLGGASVDRDDKHIRYLIQNDVLIQENHG